MALSENKVSVQNFTRGLNTDFHELNCPPDVTVDEANCDLNRKGYRQRRLGIAYETGYVQNAAQYGPSTMSTQYLKSYRWNHVNNSALINFLVVQQGATLSFYDLAYTPTCDGLKTFTVNLATYAAPGVTDTSLKGVSIASGNGVLFVAGELINPFYITYDDGTDTITVTTVNIKIRDLIEQDANPPDARLTSITAARQYDLYNQGWNTSNVRLYYYNIGPTIEAGPTTVFWYYYWTESVYPPKTGPWWVGKRIGDKGIEVFDPYQYESVSKGNTLGSLGHYIVDAFNIDRTTASGISGLPVVVTTTRPKCVAFFAGKVFYAVGNTIYYSQTISRASDLSCVGKCYQEADPTAEQINNLVATDGGTITIPQSAEPVAFFVLENTLIYFSTNGTWLISGGATNTGFSSTDYSVNKISDVSCTSERTIVNADGIPIWWAPQGIYTLKPTATKQSFQVDNISLKRVQNFYDAILPLAKQNATGAYDRVQKRAVWLFNSSTNQNDVSNRFYYNDILVLDLLFDAFLHHTISDNTELQPSKVVDVFNIQQIQTSTAIETITDNSGNLIVDGTANHVTISVDSLVNQTTVTHDLNYMVVGPVGITGSTGATNMTVAFADFTSCDFLDWSDYTTIGLGADYVSYLDCYYTIAGYMTPHFQPSYDSMMWMYSPYVYVFLDQPARACQTTTITIPGTSPTTTTNQIWATNITDSLTSGTITKHAMVPDYINNNMFRFVANGNNHTLIRKYNGATGDELASVDISTLGIGTTNQSSPSVALSYNGYLVFPDSASNSPQIDCVASDLTLAGTFGSNSGLANPSATHAGAPYAMAPMRYGTTDYVVSTQLYSLGNTVEAYTVPGLAHTIIGTIDEGQGVIGRGLISSLSGTACILGRPKPSQFPSTAGLGIYLLTVTAGGFTLSKKGTVLPAAVDATWTHFTAAYGVAYDQTDNNALIMVSTADAVTNKNYLVKVNMTNAAVVWTCIISQPIADADACLMRSNITAQRFYYMDSNNTLLTINTNNGTKVSSTVGNLSSSSYQISDDVTASMYAGGNTTTTWSQGVTTPTYLGTYMGTNGVHTVVSGDKLDLRWFVGGVVIPGTGPTTLYSTSVLPNASSCKLQVAWDWSSASASHKWAQQVETYRYRANFFVATSKNKVRGKGKAMQLRFSSTMGKDFNLIGWGIWYTKNQHP